MSQKILFLGDTHGDLDFVHLACIIASDNNAEIIQVGDWGFVWPNGSQLDDLSKKMVAWNVKMRFIDGNHDWHSKLNELAVAAGGVPDAGGIVRTPVEIAPNVIYQPRGSHYKDDDGTVFSFMGGAPSIDKHFRRDGLSWWATETITKEDMEVAMDSPKCHVLVTHDAPDYPPGFRPKGEPEFRVASKQSMNNVKRLRTINGPRLHVHGHWHYAYVDGVTRGLDCNWASNMSLAYFLWERNAPPETTSEDLPAT